LSGVLLDLRGDTLRLTGSDLDLTITVETTVAGQAAGSSK
jgi:DNA polymerase III sliding clamp (beta) subunit (PCNA family)